jgi:alkanesulfonate monooxygenase SsuD/methylene tetrahydromethanopterin reductase-like flavin-dependent oxidoreductase (luciferase family)
MVTSQSYRNPVLLAKMAASLDNISDGRLYFGIGAGWKEIEYKAYNIPFPKPIVRIKQLNESIEIAKRMFYKQKADYQGKYYIVNNCVAMPKPIQNPLPIVIGGTGNQTLKVTAKHANIANFAWNTSIEIFEEKLRVLETHCNKIGRDPGEIRKSAGLIIKFTDVEASMVVPYIKYTGGSTRESKTPVEVVEFIKSYIDLGVDHIVIMFPYGEEKESMKIIKKEVEPKL